MIMAKRFGKINSYAEWRRPKLVENSLELLDKEIPKYKDQIKFVHLSFTTDPFMFKQKEVGKLTLKIIERLNKDNIKCTVLTKGIYPRSLTNKEKYGSNNEYGITLVSLDKKFRDKFEPYSASYHQRIKSLKSLHYAGLKTWVSIEPYPTPNILEQNLTKILERVSFVDKIIFGKLNYNTKSNAFKDSSSFFEERAEEVLDFCREKGIACHIKFGTKEQYNPKSAKIFK
jgi:DNA repair photolyase